MPLGTPQDLYSLIKIPVILCGLNAQLTAFKHCIIEWSLLQPPKVDDYPYFTNEDNEMQIGKVYFQIQPANKW